MVVPVCLPWSEYLDDSHPARDIKDLNDNGDFETQDKKAKFSILHKYLPRVVAKLAWEQHIGLELLLC